MASPPPDAPEPAGFANCPECAYVATGTAEFCYACAHQSIETVHARHCNSCDQALGQTGACGNPLCDGRSVEQRGWEKIHAIAMRSGSLEGAISAYKYPPHIKGWAWIFGRIIVGYLESHRAEFERFGAIIPMPTFVGEGGREWDHVAKIVERAAVEGPDWPFKQGVISMTGPAPKMTSRAGFRDRADMAESTLQPLLLVEDQVSINGQDVLVIDDVLTTGVSMREVAKKLKEAGARSVTGLVLARQPF